MITKKIIALAPLIFGYLFAHAQWKPAGDNLKTIWGEQLNPKSVWQEYPRPIMERDAWQNLNGLWQYAILPKGNTMPSAYDGKILVPFCVESSLSGVQKKLDDHHELWYQRTFVVPTKWKNQRIRLNFGAVDWKTDVYVNNTLIGTHTGGYTPFSFDVTPYLNKSGTQKLVVKVWDPTDKGYQPVGKQMINNHLIWYTAVSGIWQTVWMEPVADQFIDNVNTIADIDSSKLTVKVSTDTSWGNSVSVILKDSGKIISEEKAVAGRDIILAIKNPKLWDTQNPFLYDLKIILYHKGVAVDSVRSYAAMRKISTARDKNGFMRIQLNNKDIFPYGPLDQGWWPDGLYTPPSDQAMLFDIKKTKKWGFNMIRKHMKVEPARWYTYCDRMGILVWQDMPSSDGYSPKWEPFKYDSGIDVTRSPESDANYRKEWLEIMEHLMPNPCIVTWTPFNEAWGQYHTIEIADWTKQHDPTRLVDPASGGNHRPCGDILDVHHYPEPELPLFDLQRANVIGEFGGILLTLDSHLWKANSKEYWDSRKHKSKEEITNLYVDYLRQLKGLIAKGLSAAVYTQTTDVEVEVNGLMTYDRKVIKMDETAVEKANTDVTNYFNQ